MTLTNNKCSDVLGQRRLKSNGGLPFRRSQANGLVGEIVVCLNHPHRLATGTHQDRMRDRGVPSDAHAPQKRRVTYAGRAENDVVSSGEICRIEYLLYF